MANREGHLNVPIPPDMKSRPADHRGFPVPWFVTNKTADGHWDFVAIERARMIEAIRHSKCWVSGKKLGRYKAFCIGPMCAINRTSGDPPVTREIALWSVKVCPFMSRPLARRADKSLPQVKEVQDGVAILRNPGVTGVWVTCNSEYQPGRGFYLGDPMEVTWWCKGGPATRDQVLASVASGIHHLESMAAKEGADALRELEKYRLRAEPLWPAA